MLLVMARAEDIDCLNRPPCLCQHFAHSKQSRQRGRSRPADSSAGLPPTEKFGAVATFFDAPTALHATRYRPAKWSRNVIRARKSSSSAAYVKAGQNFPRLANSYQIVGVHAEHVSNISSTDYPGHFPGEDHRWDLEKFRKVCALDPALRASTTLTNARTSASNFTATSSSSPNSPSSASMPPSPTLSAVS